jgi:hypothetical protein
VNYKISSIPVFDKQAKRLSKKYRSLKNDLTILVKSLEKHPKQGRALGNNFHKIRLSVTSKGKGKSGGARIIPYLKIVSNTVYLISIYDKSEKTTITDEELEQIFKAIP